MAMNKLLLRLAMLLLVAMAAACSPQPAAAVPAPPVSTQSVSCVSEDYTGTKLLWCQKICETAMTPDQRQVWIHRWINRYRDLPYCLVDES